MRHIAEALSVTHPLSYADLKLPPSLSAALDTLVSMGVPALIEWRCCSEQLLWRLVQQLAPLSMALVQLMPQHVRKICSHLRLALVAAIAVNQGLANPPHIVTILVDDMGWYVARGTWHGTLLL